MKNRINFIAGAVLIILAASLWGVDGVILTPKLFNLVDIAFIVFLLHAGPFVAFAVTMGPFGGQFRKAINFRPADWFLLLAIAATGGAIGTLAIVKALISVHFMPLSVVVLIQKLQPVFAVVLAMIMLKERPGKRFFILAGIALIASYFMAFGFRLPNIQKDQNIIEAVIYSLIAAVAFGSATTLGKKALVRHDSTTVLFYRYALTTLIMLVVVVINGSLFTKFPAVTPVNWIVFAITWITTGSGAIFIYYLGLKKVSASVSTICELFFPITTLVLDYFVNKSVLSPIQLSAATVMIACILAISLFPKNKMVAEKEIAA
jgi:drug/metabolite transporter (DMT)-like permease